MGKNKQKNIITDKKEFEKAVSLFQLYIPVKIAKELRDKFDSAISNHFINMGIESYGYTTYPLVNSYRFKRTS